MLNIYPIGIIYSPYKKIEDCPHNGWISKNVCNIKIKKIYTDGIIGMNVNDIIHVLWWFDKAPRNILKNKLEGNIYETGVFAMRSPHRPNPIALSLCKVMDIKNDTISVKGLEAINGSIVLDIKKVKEIAENSGN